MSLVGPLSFSDCFAWLRKAALIQSGVAARAGSCLDTKTGCTPRARPQTREVRVRLVPVRSHQRPEDRRPLDACAIKGLAEESGFIDTSRGGQSQVKARRGLIGSKADAGSSKPERDRVPRISTVGASRDAKGARPRFLFGSGAAAEEGAAPRRSTVRMNSDETPNWEGNCASAEHLQATKVHLQELEISNRTVIATLAVSIFT